MINEQIILWVVKNMESYFGKERVSEEVVDKLRRVVCGLGKSLPTILREKKRAGISNVIQFILIKDEKSGEIRPHYELHGTLRTIINHSSSKLIKTEEDFKQNLYKSICKQLLIEKKQVETFVSIFSKAINDLITNGHELSINLQFCHIKINKKYCQCCFKKNFIQSINTQPSKIELPRYHLRLCSGSKCNKKTINIVEETEKLQQNKWKEIKEGNLYDRPSLQQIKNLFDRGKELQLKYKHFFNA